jgi:NAD(P)H-dependent flavin oxidoreductase YrpB (nitropropane dioxygenase family)
MKPLIIGNLQARYPIIQGGMGVGVSRWRLAGTVAKEGGIGIISTAQIGYDEPEFARQQIPTNLKAIKKHIDMAKAIANGGIVGVNIMVATKHYESYVKAACEAGTDVIISGAGLPITLPELTSGYDVKIAPIVSSLKATMVMLKMWDRKYNQTADFIVVEGPKAGGHLGFTREQIESISDADFDIIIKDIVEYVKEFEDKYQKDIPIIVAGGIYDREDIKHVMSLGADGVQISTRFVVTEECDASDEFKQAYLNAKKEDIEVVTSPVGMPGRAILTPFIKRTKEGRIPVDKCFKCLERCNPMDTPYCITKSLVNAVDGNINEGLVFCGVNAYRLDKMTTVKEIFDELIY